MSKIHINDIEFVSDNLSVNGKLALAAIQLIERKIDKIKSEIFVTETAHNLCLDIIREELEENVDYF